MSATPGPWVVVADDDEEKGYVVAHGKYQDAVAHIEPIFEDAVEIANARLIAAAPDLLALAKQYASEHPDRADIADVIRRAEGQ